MSKAQSEIDLVAGALDARPEAMARALAALLDATAWAAVVSAALPDADKAVLVEQAATLLKRAGMADTDAAAAVEAELVKVRPVVKDDDGGGEIGPIEGSVK